MTTLKEERKTITAKTTIAALTKRKAWKALGAHFNEIRELHLRDLFAEDPKRGERMTLEAVGLYLDYSKNRINDETLESAVEPKLTHDSSTNSLIRKYRELRAL